MCQEYNLTLLHLSNQQLRNTTQSMDKQVKCKRKFRLDDKIQHSGNSPGSSVGHSLIKWEKSALSFFS